MSPLVARNAILNLLHDTLPGMLAVYAFGSYVSGQAHADSDLDLAVLVPGHADPLLLWEIASQIAGLTACPIDLLDLRTASTVMQYQIITTGERWWAADAQAALYEAAILSEKTALDTARAGLIADIEKRGNVYG